MSNQFFEKPILNSPYLCPVRHWELDADGQPTQKILERYGKGPATVYRKAEKGINDDS